MSSDNLELSEEDVFIWNEFKSQSANGFCDFNNLNAEKSVDFVSIETAYKNLILEQFNFFSTWNIEGKKWIAIPNAQWVSLRESINRYCINAETSALLLIVALINDKIADEMNTKEKVYLDLYSLKNDVEQLKYVVDRYKESGNNSGDLASISFKFSNPMNTINFTNTWTIESIIDAIKGLDKLIEQDFDIDINKPSISKLRNVASVSCYNFFSTQNGIFSFKAKDHVYLFIHHLLEAVGVEDEARDDVNKIDVIKKRVQRYITNDNT